MEALGVFWRNFAAESGAGEWPTMRWYSNSALVGKLAAGDTLWLFTSGKACEMPEAHRAYLVQLLVVASVADNRGESSRYASDEFRYTVHADRQRSLRIVPPLLVDRALRPPQADDAAPIGRLRQGPFRLSEEALSRLAILLDDRRRPPHKRT